MATYSAALPGSVAPYDMFDGASGASGPASGDTGSTGAGSSWTDGTFAPYSSSYSAALAPWWYDLLKNRILIKPTTIDAGHVVESVVHQGIIWNTYESQTATVTNLNFQNYDGITVDDVDLGQKILPRRDLVIDYIVSGIGPLVINASFTYTFDLGTVTQYLIGDRGLVLRNPPIDSGYSETLILDTDIFRAQDGTEYREAMFHTADGPLHYVTLYVKAFTQVEFEDILSLITFGVRYSISVPLWFSLTTLTSDATAVTTIACDTTNREFTTDHNVLIMSATDITNYAVRAVDTVNPASLVLNSEVTGFVTGDYVLPIVPVTLPANMDAPASFYPHITVKIEGREII